LKDAPIKVLLVDDHALFREGVAEIFAAEEDTRVIGEAGNGLEAIAISEREKPDVVLLDVEMPVMGAERAIGGILRASPYSKVLVLTITTNPAWFGNFWRWELTRTSSRTRRGRSS
jgi:two-component system nitrate/nitrite response regulator NarL